MSDGDFSISISYEEDTDVDENGIYKAIWHTLNLAQAPIPCGMTLVLTSAERVRDLNRDYAGIDETTDVLSFGVEGDPYAAEPDEPPYLGDVVIAVPVAEAQAQAAGHSLLSEIQTLAIHGTLHLLGYDHQNPDQQAEMWALQSAVLDTVRTINS
ncbi:MAG: rRNA maturation RNase YbeY [Anaerolineae bacterium]|nr:rRNA maturation RNase YbeY [Anaerolineae bacterium]